MDDGNECGPVAHEQIVLVCNHGRVPLPQLLRLPPVSSTSSTLGGVRKGSEGAGRVGPRLGGSVDGTGRGGAAGRELDSGSILAPLMEKLMETGHVEEFVEQVGVPSFCFCFPRMAVGRRERAGDPRTGYFAFDLLLRFDSLQFLTAELIHRTQVAPNLSLPVGFVCALTCMAYKVWLLYGSRPYEMRVQPVLPSLLCSHTFSTKRVAYQALGDRDFRVFLEDSVAHVLPVFVAESKVAAVEQLAALCDRFEVLRSAATGLSQFLQNCVSCRAMDMDGEGDGEGEDGLRHAPQHMLRRSCVVDEPCAHVSARRTIPSIST